jgi:hypothetical protein
VTTLAGLSASSLRVSPLRRAFCIPLAVLTTAAGVGPYLDGGSFRSPVFDTFRDVAPLTVWGAVWIVATILVVWASTTGNWVAYVSAHVVVAFLCAFWMMVLVKSRVVDGNAVSPTAFGLWAFPTVYCLVALFVPIAAVPSKDALHKLG